MSERTRSGSLRPPHRATLDVMRPRRGVLGFVAALALAGCASGAGATATPGAVATPGAIATSTPAAQPAATQTPSGPTIISRGTFHDVDGTAAGEVTLGHLANGRFEIVFENFSTATNAHIDVILLPVADVTKDGDVDKTAILDLGPLKAADGMQDYPLPATVDAMGYHTVVLWDTEMAHAIAAAPLR